VGHPCARLGFGIDQAVGIDGCLADVAALLASRRKAGGQDQSERAQLPQARDIAAVHLHVAPKSVGPLIRGGFFQSIIGARQGRAG
jgi:hypothetical protein